MLKAQRLVNDSIKEDGAAIDGTSRTCVQGCRAGRGDTLAPVNAACAPHFGQQRLPT